MLSWPLLELTPQSCRRVESGASFDLFWGGFLDVAFFFKPVSSIINSSFHPQTRTNLTYIYLLLNQTFFIIQQTTSKLNDLSYTATRKNFTGYLIRLLSLARFTSLSSLNWKLRRFAWLRTSSYFQAPSTINLRQLPLMADLSSNGTSTMDALKDNASAAYSSVANGPVAQNVRDQHAKTSAEFFNLAASRQTPANPAATGQPLTHYHSFFSELLSWNNPRASAIAYAGTVAFILAARYLDILRYSFKFTWMVLGITIAAEIVGKTLFNSGFATQLRPRQYYTLSRDGLDVIASDVHELVNFFVIETQRILFAENVPASVAVAAGAFSSYYLAKILPYWGLALLATTVLFAAPLIYTTNQELIDHHVKQAGEMIGAQSAQLRAVAQKHTETATQVTKQYMGDYTAKAQAMIRGAPAIPSAPIKNKPVAEDFPEVPKEDLKHENDGKYEDIKLEEQEPVMSTTE